MHRSVALLAALLMTPWLSLPASAQEVAPPPDGPVLEDGQGDVTLELPAEQSLAFPADLHPSTDLVALMLQEDPQAFAFTVQVASFDDPLVGGFNEYIVYFRHGEQRYGVQFFNGIAPGSASIFNAALLIEDPGTKRYLFGDLLETEVDAATASVTATVPREMLLDVDGTPPMPGRILDEFRVQSLTAAILDGFSFQGIDAGGGYLQDRVPDDGVSDATWPVQFGISQSGNARLYSDEPFRVSNGEATTFVFEVEATNVGSGAASYSMDVIGAPAGWDVRVPTTSIRLDGNTSTTVPIVVRTLFAHNHGSTDSFVVEMTDRNDANSIGRVELGVRYPLIPQPAGHHDTLWLHSFDDADVLSTAIIATFNAVYGFGSTGRVFMNAFEGDETYAADHRVNVVGEYCGSRLLSGNTTVESLYCWDVRLEPGLQMGLDFDLSGTGTISVPVQSLLPALGAKVEGMLYHLSPIPENGQEWDRVATEIARIQPGQSVPLDANAPKVLEGQIIPLDPADYIPYERGQGLQLMITVALERPDNILIGPRPPRPEIAPGGTLQLPLFEYEDDVTEIFASGREIFFSVEDTQERAVNPGETVLYNVTLYNDSPFDDNFRLLLSGSNLAWGTLLGSETLSLNPGESGSVAVAVRAPDDAIDGDRSDLLLEAYSGEQQQLAALVRLVTNVDTDVDHGDESAAADALGEDEEESPLGLLLVVTAVAAAVVLQRRR